MFSRTATAIAQTAAGCDFVSDGRFVLGLGASGPQVIEGFHGVPYEHPMPRIREYIEVCRMVWRREPVVYDGQTVQIPLPAGQGTGLGKPLKLINHPKRADIPVFWASLMGKSVTNTARHANGWLPVFFDPEKFEEVWGDDLRAGLGRPRPVARPAADLRRRHGGDRRRVRRRRRRSRARHGPARTPPSTSVGWGRGTRTSTTRSPSATATSTRPREIQDLYLSGRKEEAAAAVPRALLAGTNLVGPESHVAERIAAYEAAGVTHLNVTPVGPDPVKTIETLRTLLD